MRRQEPTRGSGATAAVARWADGQDKGTPTVFAVPRSLGLPQGRAMGDYEDHDLLVARHTSSRKDRHRRKKYRRDRVRPEDHEDLVAGLRQSHDAWTDVVKDRHADDDRYDYEERRVAVGAGVARPSGRRRGATTTTSWSRSSGSWPRSCTAGAAPRVHGEAARPPAQARAGARRARQAEPGGTSSASRPSCRAWRRARSCRTRRWPGPASEGAGDGHDHAGTLPRPAEEMPYKDGLLTWTEENVGEIFACIAFKHLKSAEDKNDNEEAEENAREIKQAAMAHGVDGRALLHLTIEDMEKIGEKAGHVEGGGECALKFVGHRIAILSSIHAFVEAYKAEPWDRVKELPLLVRAGKNRHEGEAKLTDGALQDVRHRPNSWETIRTRPSRPPWCTSPASRRRRSGRRSPCPSSPRCS